MKRLSEIKVKKQSEVLTDEEMKRIVGGGLNYCWFECYCVGNTDHTFPIDVLPPCDTNAPWDRQLEECPGSGLANCRYVGMISW